MISIFAENRREATVDSTYKNRAQWCKLSIQAAASMAPLGDLGTIKNQVVKSNGKH